MLDVDIKKEESNRDGWKYSHPSFGRVRIGHCTGDVHLFGSEVRTHSFVSLTVSECEVTQDLGRNWYYSNTEIVEAWMTPVQYAEMIASPNTEGVPCTIRARCDKGHIVPKNIDTVTEFTRSEIERKANSIHKRVLTLSKQVSEILNQKGTVKKTDKEAVISLVNKIAQDIGSNFKFQEECVKESIERSVVEAKAEIDYHINHAVTRLGIDALKSPEAIKLIMSKKDN